MAVAYAEVNHGRWIVRCPYCQFGQARESGDWWFCRQCLNAAGNHLRVRVHWPAEREAIERLLAARPYSWNRNWQPDETLDDLLAENRQHRVGVEA